MDGVLFPEKLPEILYWGRGSSNRTAPHVHSFFQLEIGIAGHFHGYGSGPGETVDIRSGDCWLIAPETPHGFGECGEPFEFLSLKFEFPRFDCTPRNDAVTQALATRLVELLSSETPLKVTDAARQRILQYALYDLLRELASATPPPREQPPLLRKISEAVLQQGYRINVKMLAATLNCTPGALQYQFHKINNSEFSNPKAYIDAVLVLAAGNHLRYSDLKTGEIARLLNFPDVYTFSRFFKHRTGFTPREWRQK